MKNFLQETIEELTENKHNTDEVRWVGSRDGLYSMSWEEFRDLADFEYDCGYGCTEIPKDLVVVGDDWWLERREYDGSEWWEYKKSHSEWMPPEDCDIARKLELGQEATRGHQS